MSDMFEVDFLALLQGSVQFRQWEIARSVGVPPSVLLESDFLSTVRELVFRRHYNVSGMCFFVFSSLSVPISSVLAALLELDLDGSSERDFFSVLSSLVRLKLFPLKLTA